MYVILGLTVKQNLCLKKLFLHKKIARQFGRRSRKSDCVRFGGAQWEDEDQPLTGERDFCGSKKLCLSFPSVVKF